ncbi:MAG: T9SS C-terminal target domain-containing protein [Bacteroidetes bacterium]|nr:MAG: T9SS C-terminal target domain-containing protein [Bacteroidota bacterium]
MIFRYKICLTVLLLSGHLAAQFAPPAGQEGSTAIHVDDPQFINWATGCEVERGLQNILMESLGETTNGEAENVPGPADNLVVSLGDAGVATLTFEHPIRNGEGWDFAVFENGFDDLFLEFAFVEVSSDGAQFVRFPATSLTDTTEQTATFGVSDATKVNNLAGKYRGGYGTPFDLDELVGYADILDLENITHVRIIDVIGSIDPAIGSRDAFGNLVNDPFPTGFPVGGFDLDAVGVIHQSVEVANEEVQFAPVKIFPNPVASGQKLNLEFQELNQMEEIYLKDFNGRILKRWSGKETSLDMDNIPNGVYLICFEGRERFFRKIIVAN